MFIEDESKACVDTEPDLCEVQEKPAEHILVIDDDLTQSEVLSIRFSSQGYRVSTAHTWPSA